jgi:hypothetical protein
MTSPKEFREYARECLKWAAKEPDKVKRQALIDTASMWTHAALRLEGLTPAEPAETPPFKFTIGATHDGVGSDAGPVSLLPAEP